jgi:hypothetical protein
VSKQAAVLLVVDQPVLALPVRTVHRKCQACLLFYDWFSFSFSLKL